VKKKKKKKRKSKKTTKTKKEISSSRRDFCTKTLDLDPVPPEQLSILLVYIQLHFTYSSQLPKWYQFWRSFGWGGANKLVPSFARARETVSLEVCLFVRSFEWL
jgi:hypothetical protein